MAKKAIFESRPIQFDVYTAEVGGYVHQISPAPFTLEVGKNYVIEWDGEEYPSTAIPFDSFAPGAVTIGMGEAPVAVGYLASTDYIGLIAFTSGEHTVGIYEVIEDPGIIIKNRSGKDETYYGVETVTFDTSIEGLQQTFTKGVLLGGTEIDLNLAEGDQILSAPEGFLLKEATIKKPENLIPENIAEGIDIAGIIGAFAGGGGAKVATGKIGTGSVLTTNTVVTHNLGVIPDVIICTYYQSLSSYTTTYNAWITIVFSSAFVSKYPDVKKGYRLMTDSSQKPKMTTTDSTIESGVDQSHYIADATETEFTYIPKTSGNGGTITPVCWIAIGGLT